jgi:hypothetical protein
MVLSVALASGLAGCSERDQAKIDELADKVETVVPPAQDLVDGPAGDVLGEEGKNYTSVALSAIMAAVALWRQYRLGQTKSALGSVVRAVERMPDKEKAAVKSMVGEQMVRDGNRPTANKIVEQAKA